MADYAEYWLDLANYDLSAARAMLKSKHWLYVGFMCHQVIEKALKGVISQDGSLPPKIHQLMRLASMRTFRKNDRGPEKYDPQAQPAEH